MMRATGSSTTRVATLVALLPLGACHTRGAARDAAPLLTSLSPVQVNVAGGSAGTLTLRGRGFDSLNTVHFGALRIPGVPSTNDSVMQFAVPIDDTFLPGRGPAPVQPLAGGRYDVRIEARGGVSNALPVTLTTGGVR
jgi:hypothetical protein